MGEKKLKIISIVLGVIIGLLLIFFGFTIVQRILTRAEDIAPRDVVISEVSENSAKISWTTGIETQGVVEYGTSPTSLNFFAPEAKKTKEHEVDLTLLTPKTTYYFQIRIGDKKFDNGGVPWTFTTKGKGEGQGGLVITPTPISTVILPPNSPTPASSCPYTDCAEIRSNLGRGCSMSDYIKKGCVEGTSTPTPSACNFTDCEEIKSNFGKGCSTADYIKAGCLGGTKTPTPTTSSATLTPTSTPTSTPTPTP